MADTDKSKKWVSALVENELADGLDNLAKELDTDRSKLLRQMIREKLSEAGLVRKVASGMKGKVIAR